jgi:DNA-binding GntR family transcriptional regulator
MTSLPRLTHSSISDEVYKVIKERILSKSFAPGQRLNLTEMEQQLGVSRTPLKDALNRIALEGLVEIIPRSGTYVSDPTIEEVEETFDVRRILEVYAAELAVQRMTESQIQQARDIVRDLRKLIDASDWRQILQDHIDLDYDLHELIVLSTGNNYLVKLWAQIMCVQISAVRYRRIGRELDRATKEHEEMLSALESRDAAALQQALTCHLERSRRSLRVDWKALDTD